MNGDDLKEVLRERPFQPIELALSDGRMVLVRHPDQVFVARRHAIVGLAHIKGRLTNLRTPTTDDRFVKDWILLDLIHIVSAEPAEHHTNGRTPKRRPRLKK